jgi:hypothetical protein
MSEGISLFARPSVAGDAPLSSIKYLGRPDNEVYSVAHLPGRGYLFATTLGLLLLPAELNREVGRSAPAAPDQVQNLSALVPITLPGSTTVPDLLHVDARQRVWVMQPGQVSVWRPKAFPAGAQPATSVTSHR